MTHALRGSALLCLALACASPTAVSGADAGPGDAGFIDGGASTDAGIDSGVDAGLDAGHEQAGKDGGVDAGADAGRDGGQGASDAGQDAGADAGWWFSPTTTVAELTQNNTSACGADAGPCTEAWTPTHKVTYGSGSSYSGQTKTIDGFWDNPVPSGTQTPASALGSVSKVPMSALLPGYNVPVWVATQNWWGGSGHIDNGEVSSNATQMANEVADQVSRGIAGQNVDWYGPGSTADLALPYIQAAAEATDGGYQFAVTIDKGYFTNCGETVACLNSAISYISTHYASSPAYVTDGAGHPLIFFFINSYYPTQYAILQSAGINDLNTRFVMYEPNGFPGNSPANTVGEFGWVNPADGTALATTTGTQGSFDAEPDFGFKGATNFFTNAKANQTSYIVSEAYKGFDDNLANWSGDRIVDQQCGLTWLQTFDHTGSYGGSASYLGNLNYLALGDKIDFVMVDTWDDYEEGSEIETGIDNCLSSLDATLSANTLSWTPTWGADPMNSAVSGSEATIYSYSIYLAQSGGTGLMPLTSVACSGGTCPHSLDVSQLGIQGGPWVFYVQAVGQPSIVNTLSAPTSSTYTAP